MIHGQPYEMDIANEMMSALFLGNSGDEEVECWSSPKENEMWVESSSSCKKSQGGRNPGFLSILGSRIYTEDISDDGNDVYSCHSMDIGSVDSYCSLNCSDSSSDDSSIDDVAEDYLEGIGGSDVILDTKWLTEAVLDAEGNGSDPGDANIYSNSDFDNATKKWDVDSMKEGFGHCGGTKSSSSKKLQKHLCAQRKWKFSYDLDDDKLLNESVVYSGGKSHMRRLRQSPLFETPKNKHSWSFPGSKKKHKKEKILWKRRERMKHHGVDLRQINPYARKGADQIWVKRKEQSSAKKVTPAKTIKHGKSKGLSLSGRCSKGVATLSTPQPLPFISSGVMQDGDKALSTFSRDGKSVTSILTDCPKLGSFEVHTKGFGSRMMAQMGFVEGGGLGKDGQGVVDPIEAKVRPRSLGLGMIFQENVVATTGKTNPSSHSSCHQKYEKRAGACSTEFSRKQTKIGRNAADQIWVKREESSSSGQKITSAKTIKHYKSKWPSAQPLPFISNGVLQAENMDMSTFVKEEKTSISSILADCPKLGGFEAHTKGFGSRIMAKMGFVEGGGLGKDGQGVVDPVQVKIRPKSLGLGMIVKENSPSGLGLGR